MKVRVNVAACVGHARCAAVAPEVYDLDENGFNVTAEKDVDESLRSQAIRGMRACPERVIWVEGASDRD
jgi:ferredoxin